jgi:hypothetical protein
MRLGTPKERETTMRLGTPKERKTTMRLGTPKERATTMRLGTPKERETTMRLGTPKERETTMRLGTPKERETMGTFQEVSLLPHINNQEDRRIGDDCSGGATYLRDRSWVGNKGESCDLLWRL